VRFIFIETIKLGLPIFFSKTVALHAFIVSMIVGIILAFINHVNLIFSGNISMECWVKMIATCFVPYNVFLVTTTLSILENKN
jgi:hypothetical protein